MNAVIFSRGGIPEFAKARRLGLPLRFLAVEVKNPIIMAYWHLRCEPSEHSRRCDDRSLHRVLLRDVRPDRQVEKIFSTDPVGTPQTMHFWPYRSGRKQT
jgi:hypothetical protein